MSKVVTEDDQGSSCEATGHPVECVEPVEGEVLEGSTSVTITNANGDTEGIATEQSNLSFDFHSHTYNGSCTDNQSHTIGSMNVSSSVTINGEQIVTPQNGVATDPGSDGDVNIDGTGINDSVNIT